MKTENRVNQYKENDNKKTVSVIIPTYNREKTVVNAIQSVLSQSFPPKEIIVVDDCSTDNTEHIVKGMNDKRIVYIRLDQRQGAAHARNIGIKMSTGEYIAFQDSDDIWKCNKLEIQTEYISETNCDVVFCPYYRIYQNDYSNLIPNPRLYSYNTLESSIKTVLQKTNVIGTPTILMHRDVTENIGGFDESISKYEDYEYVIRIVQNYKIGFVQKPLVDSYLQADSITNCKDIEWDAYIGILQKHIDFLDSEEFVRLFCNGGYLLGQDGINLERIQLLRDVVGENAVDTILNHLAIRLITDRKSAEKRFDCYINKLTDKGFYIYGAGKRGKELYQRVKKQKLSPKNFIVSDESNISEEIEGISIIDLKHVADENPIIIVAVSESLIPIIIDNMLSKGFTNYCIFPV